MKSGTGQRPLRVGEEVRHALAAILERGQVRELTALGQAVTVTEVRMSPDLRNATVFVTPLGGGEAAEVVAALTRAKPYLRRALAHAVRLKNIPDMAFRADRSFDEASRIEELLAEPRVARDLGAGDDGSDDGA